jgi:hypothetical protein
MSMDPIRREIHRTHPGAAGDGVNRPSVFQGSAARGTVGARIQGAAMTTYMVGLKLEMRNKVLTIEAEDALVAALKIKLENPEALITYVRKSNQRGDRRHPHEALQNRKGA